MYKKTTIILYFLLVSISAISDTVKTYTYNQSDQVISIDDSADPSKNVVFTYDGAGNRISKTQDGVLTEYKWSARGNLVEVSRNGMWLARYEYDYQNLRVSKSIREVGKNEVKTLYIYDQLTKNLIAETNVIGNIIAQYHWANGSLVAENRGNRNYYYHNDLHGTPTAITAVDGIIIARFEYDPFGNIRYVQGTDTSPFGFTGYYGDDETGLYYAQQRFYDSELGAFISEDPLEGTTGDPVSFHRYLYTKANPNKYVDKDGRCSSVMNLIDPSACDRHMAVFTDPKALEEMIIETRLDGARVAGVVQAVGDLVIGTVQTAEDIGGTYLEAASDGYFAKGSMLRLRGQVNGTVEFVTHPIDTIKKSISSHNERVNAMIASGDFEGAAKERTRFGATGLLAIVGGVAGVKSAMNKFKPNKPIDPPPPNNDMTGIVTEGGGNKLDLVGFNDPTKTKRRTWQESEAQVLANNQGFQPQVSFVEGGQVTYGTKGSVRPEGFDFKNNSSIEVKNYNVQNANGQSNIVRNIVKQIKQRNENLPSGSTQNIVIDVRGQDVTPSTLKNIQNSIVEKSGISAKNITFIED